jgi:hypothetical protein
MKTAMQELVEEMEQSPLMFAPALALIKEKNFLEKEKEQHKQTWLDSTAQFDNAAAMTYKKDFEQYYNETFNTNGNENSARLWRIRIQQAECNRPD